MADILEVQTNPLFGWWYSWLPVKEIDGMPDFTAAATSKNLDTVKLKWRVDDPKGGKPWEHSAEIVPDYGFHGVEYALVHTFPTFQKTVIDELIRPMGIM